MAAILKIDISSYLSEKSSSVDEILYTAADFELGERHGDAENAGMENGEHEKYGGGKRGTGKRGTVSHSPAATVNIGLPVNSGTLQMTQKCKHFASSP